MFNYNQSKKLALALKQCNFSFSHHTMVDDIFDDYIFDFNFINCIKLAFSDSAENVSLREYFKLFALNVTHPTSESYNSYNRNSGKITTQLESHLGKFDLLIGITDHYLVNYEKVPFYFFQLLFFFMQPFGKIGIVPVHYNYNSDIQAIISIPDSFIHELDDQAPTRIVIPAEEILKINTYPNQEQFIQFDSLFSDYWYDKHQLSFFDYFNNIYSKKISK